MLLKKQEPNGAMRVKMSEGMDVLDEALVAGVNSSATEMRREN